MKTHGTQLLLTLDYPGDVGGIATYYAGLVKTHPEIEVFLVHKTTRRLAWVRSLIPIFRKIHTRKVKQLIVGSALPLGYIALLARFCPRFHIPYTVYIHGLDVLHKDMSRWKRFWIQIVLLCARHITANSLYVMNAARRMYSLKPQKMDVSYPRIDESMIESAGSVTPLPTVPSGVKVLLSVGRLVARKGFDMTIAALGLLKQKNPDCAICYWIIGDGDDRERLLECARRAQVVDDVQFLGSVPVSHLYGYFRTCDIFIMPSREIRGDVEGFGIVFLEAAVFKKPVIGGKSGGIPEAVIHEKTGLLVNPENPGEIADAIENLLTHPEFARQLGETGYARVVKEFALNYRKHNT